MEIRDDRENRQGQPGEEMAEAVSHARKATGEEKAEKPDVSKAAQAAEARPDAMESTENGEISLALEGGQSQTGLTAEEMERRARRRAKRRRKRKKELKQTVKEQLRTERLEKRAEQLGITVDELLARREERRQKEIEEKLARLKKAPTVLKVQNVSMKFNLSAEKVEDLKSFFIKFIKKDLHYQEFFALKDVSFEVKKGERVGIIGLNGAGKSTLLKIIAGVLKPTKGQVKTVGRIVPLLELGAGFDKRYTGAENIYLNGAVLGYPKEFIKEKYDEIVEFSELGQFIDVPIMNYSSGMRSRLGFAMATVVEPDILILDEVLSVGDARFKRKSEAKIQQMFDKGVTVLFVSHSIEQVKRICDTAILLEGGRILMKDEVNKVARVYQEKLNETK